MKAPLALRGTWRQNPVAACMHACSSRFPVSRAALLKVPQVCDRKTLPAQVNAGSVCHQAPQPCQQGRYALQPCVPSACALPLQELMVTTVRGSLLS